MQIQQTSTKELRTACSSGCGEFNYIDSHEINAILIKRFSLSRISHRAIRVHRLHTHPSHRCITSSQSVREKSRSALRQTKLGLLTHSRTERFWILWKVAQRERHLPRVCFALIFTAGICSRRTRATPLMRRRLRTHLLAAFPNSD